MNWHETIAYIQSEPQFESLVKSAFIDRDNNWNSNAFHNSAEFKETIALIRKKAPKAKKILDIGAGNGIASIAFAKEGYTVTALEPDESVLVGAGAIEALATELKLDNVSVVKNFAEEASLQPESFDVVYVRQALHHANNLNEFVANTAKFLKKGGLYVTIRDHVIFGQQDKELFLQQHPLHKFYGGENAFTEKEYETAFKLAGLAVDLKLRHFESVINYSPLSKTQLRLLPEAFKNAKRKFFGSLVETRVFNELTFALYGLLKRDIYLEENIPGRLRTYILRKEN